MRRVLAFVVPVCVVVLNAWVGAAHALCPMEPLLPEVNVVCGGGGGGGGGGTPPRTCTTTIPVPADSFDCQCKTSGRDPSQRCAFALPQDQCFNAIDNAAAMGLLTADAVSFLKSAGFCPIVQNFGSGNFIYDFCPMGCLAADTKVMTSTTFGKTNYVAASKITSQDTLVAMGEASSLHHVTLDTLPLQRVVFGPEQPDLYVFKLASGATLRVTQHHPMVLTSGKIVEAEEVPHGSAFMGVDGQPVAVLSISREHTNDNVYNFMTTSDTQLGHVIVAEGILVGDLKLQNELAQEESSIALRR